MKNRNFLWEAAILLKINISLIPSIDYEIINYINEIFLVFWFRVIQSRDIVYTAKHLFLEELPEIVYSGLENQYFQK